MSTALEKENAPLAPISEPNEAHRKIPKVTFIDNAEAWVDKYGDDNLFAQLNDLYQKYKFMESNLLRSKQGLKQKLPEIKKTLDMVTMLQDRAKEADKEVSTNFLLSDNIWAKATLPNDTGKVGLWLGANVMVEYDYADAIKLLEANLSNAQLKMKETEEDIDFVKDQITTSEVNMARVYNQGVANKQKKEGKY